MKRKACARAATVMSATPGTIVVAALLASMAVTGLAHEHCTSTHGVDTDASDFIAPRYAVDARLGFQSPNYAIECVGGGEAAVRSSESYCADSGN